MKVSPYSVVILAVLLCLPACTKPVEHAHEERHKIVVTSPQARDVVSTQQYVCQIHSCKHIEVRALDNGYLEEIPVKEGQSVTKGDLMFRIVPVLYQAKLDTEAAELQLMQIKYDNTKNLFQKNVVSQQEVNLAQAELAKAQAKMNLAKAELNFANVKAPFDGIIDRLNMQQGSLVEEGDMLTTLSDNSVMWVYFNVPEARYFEYEASLEEEKIKGKKNLKVELMLADGKKFSQEGQINAVEADFNNEIGTIAFRADFPNPNGLLRNGQTGTILISQIIEDAIVIPQRAKFEILAKTYTYVVEDLRAEQDEEEAVEGHTEHTAHHETEHHSEHTSEHGDVNHTEREAEPGGALGVVRQREILIERELDDIYVIKSGLAANEKIVLEGVRQVRDGEKVEYVFEAPEEVLGHLKYHAE